MSTQVDVMEMCQRLYDECVSNCKDEICSEEESERCWSIYEDCLENPDKYLG